MGDCLSKTAIKSASPVSHGGDTTCCSSSCGYTSSNDGSSRGRSSSASSTNASANDRNRFNNTRRERLREALHENLLSWKNELLAAATEGDPHLNHNVLVNIEPYDDGEEDITSTSRSIDEVYEGANDGPELGDGIAGVVRKVRNRTTGVEYAAKCFDLSAVSEDIAEPEQQSRWIEALHEEIFSMCELEDHPGIVHLEEVYESKTHLYLVEELCNGGDMFDQLHDQPEQHYAEDECADLVNQMLSAVGYMHSKHIMHRDLKLENFVFSSTPGRQANLVKVIDFGFSKHFARSGEIQHERVGTPYAVAPEVIRGAYDEKADIWAIGVIAFILLCGDAPFGGLDDERLSWIREKILRGTVEFEPECYWQTVSEGAKAFVRRLLNPDASRRPSAAEAQMDPWLLPLQ